MAKTYVTFGQAHVHHINGKTFDADCVAVIDCEGAEDGRRKAFEHFGPKFCFEYYEEMPDMSYFPRGLMEIEND